MLCERCQTREARVFMTFCTATSDDGTGETRSGVTRTRNLCEECTKEEHPEVVEQIARGCRYCGEKGGSVCPRCLKEYRRFLESKGVTWPLHKQPKEEIAGKAMVFLEVLEHMKQWVAEGRPGDAGP